MNIIDEFEASGMSEMQYLKECYDQQFTYQDYLTNCEILKRSPMSVRLYNGHMSVFCEKEHFATL